MTSSNRTQLAGVAEAEYGTTPENPRMRKQRVTSIGLTFKTDTVTSDDIRDDRMNSDPIHVGETDGGQIGIEWHYPVYGCLLDEEIKSAFCNDWLNTPFRDNDGVVAAAVVSIDAATQIVTVVNGGAFVANHLVRFTGFASAANNRLGKCTTGSGTVPVFLGAGLVDDAAPAVAARMKVVGFEGDAGDISAAVDSLMSVDLDFTTLGLSIGQWVKVAATGAYSFDTAGCNGWARVCAAVTAHNIPLDNLPVGWAADAGAGKTIRVFFGDVMKNGVGKYGVTLERGFLGQSVPTYIAQNGMRVNTMEFGGAAKEKVTGTVAFMGLKGTIATDPLDPTPDEAPINDNYPVFAMSANCGRVGEAGVALGKPDWAKSVKFAINNNLRAIDAVSDGENTAPGSVDIEDGSFDVTVTLETFFGSKALLEKVMNGTQTGINTRVFKGVQALIWEAPRLTATDGDPNVSGKNTDVTLPATFSASKDSVTGAQLILNRIEYFQ